MTHWEYSVTYPAAMKSLLADREGQTAYLRFHAEHHHRIRHCNFIWGHAASAARRSTSRPVSATPRLPVLG